MAQVRVQLNSAGVQALLKSPEVQKMCEGLAKQALQTLGDGYTSDTRMGGRRVRVEIRADTPHAYYSNRKHNHILKAVGRLKV